MSLDIKHIEASLHDYLLEREQTAEIKAMIKDLNQTAIGLKEFKDHSAWSHVALARHAERPTALDYINRIFPDFIELHGDRLYADDASIVGGIASINGRPVTIIAQQKGKTTEENIKRNFGMPHPEGYRKALRLMKQAEKFNRPIITFVDTPGAYPGLGAEERGQGEAIARNLMEMSQLKVPVLSIVIGEGGSGGALAIAVANEVMMLEHSIYSILSPEGFASILWKDAGLAKKAAGIMKLTAADLKNFSIIDDVILEPSEGAHTYPEIMAYRINEKIVGFIQKYEGRTANYIMNQRYKKFRNMGVFKRLTSLL